VKFNVPQIKDPDFITSLFMLISDSISELKLESGKFPDRITFNGSLGKELYEIIVQKGWDLSRFGPKFENSISNRIVFDYSKPIDQITDGGAQLDSSLNGKTINGIPGPETVQKILSTTIGTGFTIERQIRPKLEIKLIRKNG
jgi:hypothetical protein